jgi:hypothetical protein
MQTLYEGETIESRLEDIWGKLKYVPKSEYETGLYYVFYKEDVRFLLELLNKGSENKYE